MVGVIDQLKGLVAATQDPFDGSSLLQDTDLPLVLIQSLEDGLVSPSQAAPFQETHKGGVVVYPRRMVTSLADALDPLAVHVNWLHAGLSLSIHHINTSFQCVLLTHPINAPILSTHPLNHPLNP